MGECRRSHPKSEAFCLGPELLLGHSALGSESSLIRAMLLQMFQFVWLKFIFKARSFTALFRYSPRGRQPSTQLSQAACRGTRLCRPH